MSDVPSVGVVIPNWNGVGHLPDCLDSLAALDFPRDRLEVIVVDNGSTDGSLDLLRRRYSWVTRIELGENLGFAEAGNRGARAASGDCVAFLNNDMRVDAGWLTGLLSQYDPGSRYVCVGGVTLSWDGSRIDFVDGWISFHAGADLDYRGVPLDETLIEDGRDLPFASGGSMLVQREVFLSLGGFDRRYFAYLEDVDFGWRLWLAGYKVRLSGKARSFHRGSATSSGVPAHQLFLLRERNALLTLIKNVSDAHLPGLLAAAALLLADRARLRSGSERAAFDLGSPDAAADELVSRSGLAALHGVGDVLADLDELLAERARIQALRQLDDDEIFELFRRPFSPASQRPEYLEASLKLRAALGLDHVFRRQRVLNLLVIGPSDSSRLRTLAEAAATYTSVIYASATPPGKIPGVRVSLIRDGGQLAELLAQCDCVVVDAHADEANVVAARSHALVAVDLGGRSWVSPALRARGDVFLCASERDPERVQQEWDGPAAPRLLVVPDRGEEQKDALRRLLWEPWRWRDAAGEAAIAVPEDLQLLLRAWRERYRRSSPALRGVGAVWRRLPARVQRGLARVGRTVS